MTLKVHHLRPAPGAKTEKVRVGRGEGGKRGKTAGRGTKGTKARYQVPASFEGGQMPLHMRLPKRGFNNANALKLAEVNLWRLQEAIDAKKLDAKSEINGEALVAAGVIRRPLDGVKLLGKGELKAKLNLTVYAASAAAKAAVEKAGGSVTTTAPVDTGEPKGKLQKKVRA